METAEPSLLGVWRPEPEPPAETLQETRGRAPRKAAKARKGAKGSASTSGADEGSQGQPEAAGEVSGAASSTALPAGEGTDG